MFLFFTPWYENKTLLFFFLNECFFDWIFELHLANIHVICSFFYTFPKRFCLLYSPWQPRFLGLHLKKYLPIWENWDYFVIFGVKIIENLYLDKSIWWTSFHKVSNYSESGTGKTRIAIFFSWKVTDGDVIISRKVMVWVLNSCYARCFPIRSNSGFFDSIICNSWTFFVA